MSTHEMSTNRSRSEAIADAKIHGDNSPHAVAGRWVDLPSGKPAFKVGVGFEIVTVPNRLAYRDSVIPQARLLAFEDDLYAEAVDFQAQAAAEIDAEMAIERYLEGGWHQGNYDYI